MKRIKLWMAEALVALVVLAGLGFGLVAMGFAMIVGLVVALAVRLAGPHIFAEVEKRTAEMQAMSQPTPPRDDTPDQPHSTAHAPA